MSADAVVPHMLVTVRSLDDGDDEETYLLAEHGEEEAGCGTGTPWLLGTGGGRVEDEEGGARPGGATYVDVGFLVRR